MNSTSVGFLARASAAAGAAFLLLASMSSYLDWLDASEKEANAKEGNRGGSQLPVRRNLPVSCDENLNQGDRIVAKLTNEIGKEKTAELLEALGKKANGLQPSSGERGVVVCVSEDDDAEAAKVPYGFWRRFCEEDLNLVYIPAKRKQFLKSLQLVAMRRHAGCQTRPASRGMRKKDSCRNSGGCQNATKAVGLGYALLQFFVDDVQSLQCRADSEMLMTKARELRKELLYDETGRWSPSALPKLVGNAGAKWFQRWRKKYGSQPSQDRKEGGVGCHHARRSSLGRRCRPGVA